MMPQPERVPAREYTRRETLLELLNDLIAVTRQVTASADQDEFDSVSMLVRRRDASINKIERLDAGVYRRDAISDAQYEEIQRTFRELMECSRSMQETLERKSKSVLATLTSLQQHRFYSL